MALYGAKTWMLRAADQKYLEIYEMWCWRRMEKISWTDHVRNEEVLLRVNEQRNILYEIRKRKTNWIGNILRRNCLLKQAIEGKIQLGLIDKTDAYHAQHRKEGTQFPLQSNQFNQRKFHQRTNKHLSIRPQLRGRKRSKTLYQRTNNRHRKCH